jgi:hypothetical protein
MGKFEVTVSGRILSQPRMQTLRMPMSPEEQKLADQLREILWNTPRKVRVLPEVGDE